MSSLNRNARVGWAAVLCALAIQVGCGGPEKPTPDAGTTTPDAGTTTPDAGTGDTNRAPRIDSISASSKMPTPSGSITLTASAQDPDGDALSYAWTAAAGSFGTPTQSSTPWTAPATEGTQRLSLTVTDSHGLSATSTVDVIVARDTSNSVRGKSNLLFVQADGTVLSRPEDLSAVVLGAWVPTADGSSYAYQVGTGLADGTFSVSGVDRTPYLLQRGTAYYWMTSRTPDLSSPRLGRPDVVAEAAGTQLALNISGLSPWQNGLSDLMLYAPGVGIGYLARVCASDYPEPEDGATTFSGSLDYSQYLQYCGLSPAPKITPSQGDTVQVTQNVSRTDTSTLASGLTILEARRGGSLSVGSDKGTVTLTGTLSSLSTTTRSFNLIASKFEEQLLAANPGATLIEDYVDVGAVVGYSQFGNYAGFPDLGTSTNEKPGQGDFLVNLTYGNPYSSTGPLIVIGAANANVSLSVALSAGGTSKPLKVAILARTYRALGDGAAPALTPRVGAARSLLLNGMNASGALSGVGTTPVVSWVAPSLGTASYYQVRLYELSATASGGTSRALKASFSTTQTQLRMPPSFLSTGKSYYINLYTLSDTAFAEDHPRLGGPEYDSVERVSGVFQP